VQKDFSNTIGTSRHSRRCNNSVAIEVTDGVIGRPAFKSLEILGAALQADGEYGPKTDVQMLDEEITRADRALNHLKERQPD
jgi:hypothetical protein